MVFPNAKLPGSDRTDILQAHRPRGELCSGLSQLAQCHQAGHQEGDSRAAKRSTQQSLCVLPLTLTPG